MRHQHSQTLMADDTCLLSPKLSLSPLCFPVRRYAGTVTRVHGTLSVESQEFTRNYHHTPPSTEDRRLTDDRRNHIDPSCVGSFKSRPHSLAHRIYTLFNSIYSARLSSRLSLPSPLLFQPPKGKSQHPVGLVQLTPTMPLSSFLLTRMARSRSLVYSL